MGRYGLKAGGGGDVNSVFLLHIGNFRKCILGMGGVLIQEGHLFDI